MKFTTTLFTILSVTAVTYSMPQDKSKGVQTAPVQVDNTPVQQNPIQSSPVQNNPIQNDPIQVDKSPAPVGTVLGGADGSVDDDGGLPDVDADGDGLPDVDANTNAPGTGATQPLPGDNDSSVPPAASLNSNIDATANSASSVTGTATVGLLVATALFNFLL